ncbi:MAG: flagellar basal body rod protein FlgB [Bdellovibrionota bacterium]
MTEIKNVNKLFDQSIGGLSKAMDLYWFRSQAITSNISNAETPGYKSIDVNFANELEKVFNEDKQNISKTNAGHLDTSRNTSAFITPDYSGATKSDGNNVDIDIQMGKLASNAADYNLSAALVRKKLQILRNAIRYAQT